MGTVTGYTSSVNVHAAVTSGCGDDPRRPQHPHLTRPHRPHGILTQAEVATDRTGRGEASPPAVFAPWRHSTRAPLPRSPATTSWMPQRSSHTATRSRSSLRCKRSCKTLASRLTKASRTRVRRTRPSTSCRHSLELLTSLCLRCTDMPQRVQDGVDKAHKIIWGETEHTILEQAGAATDPKLSRYRKSIVRFRAKALECRDGPYQFVRAKLLYTLMPSDGTFWTTLRDPFCLCARLAMFTPVLSVVVFVSLLFMIERRDECARHHPSRHALMRSRAHTHSPHHPFPTEGARSATTAASVSDGALQARADAPRTSPRPVSYGGIGTSSSTTLSWPSPSRRLTLHPLHQLRVHPCVT